jgi:hypothetical protein
MMVVVVMVMPTRRYDDAGDNPAIGVVMVMVVMMVMVMKLHHLDISIG